MNAFHSISSWWKRFSRKRRLSMLNATDNVEEWYTHISPAGLLAAFLAFALLLFILILINDRKIMGKYTNGKLFNLIAWSTTIIMSILTVLLVVTTIFPLLGG